MLKPSKGTKVNLVATRQSPQPESHLTPLKKKDQGSNMENSLVEVGCISVTLLVVAADVSTIKETTTELEML